MKRFVIFATLGPLIGFLTLTVLIQALNYALDGSITIGVGHLVLLPAGYALGIIPATITAWFDYALRHNRYRILWTSLFAYVAGFMPLLTALLMGFLSTPYVLIFGLVGMLPGAICSWLSGNKQNSRATA